MAPGLLPFRSGIGKRIAASLTPGHVAVRDEISLLITATDGPEVLMLYRLNGCPGL